MNTGRIVLINGLVVALLLAQPALLRAEAVMELYGTFQAMGVIVTLTAGEDSDQDAAAALSYRVVGSGNYRQGLPLSRVAPGRFVGSLFNLSPGTSYDVRVSFSDPDGAPLNNTSVNGTAATRAEISIPASALSIYAGSAGSGTACSSTSPCTLTTALSRVQAGQEVVLRGGIYYQGDLSLSRSGASGAPIVIRGFQGENAVLDGSDPAVFSWASQGGGVYRATVNAADPHLVMVDGQRLYPYLSLADLQNLVWGVPGFYADGTTVYLRLAGNADPNQHTLLVSRFNSALTIEQNSIVISNLTFRHYGLGSYAKALYFNNASDNLVQDCTFAINDLGIGLKRDSHRNVFQDNTFYDTDFDWPWNAVKGGSELETGGIRMYEPMTGRGTVIRRNSFHDYFDGLGVCPDATAGITNETDVHDNLVYNTGDDGMETDGQCSNVRIWGNRFHDVLVGISLAPVYTGPVYALRNLIYRTGAGNNDYPGSPFKFNSGFGQSGPIFLFHNTADAVLPGSSGLDIKSPGSWKLIQGRNNIWSGTDYALNNANPDQPLDLDYDDLYTTQAGELVWWDGLTYRHLHTLDELRIATDQEQHGLNLVPGFSSPASGDYSLAGASLLIDQGVIIPGVNDTYSGSAPDIGAFEYIPPVPVNGVCGSSDNGSFTSAPVANLCSAGNPTTVSGLGPWSWECRGTNGGTDSQCSANLASFTLMVTKTGNGNGSITPNNGALTWFGPSGMGTWPYNSQVVLSAAPDNLSSFSGWSGDCIPSGADCSASMTGDRIVNASFIAAPRAKIGANGYATLNEAYVAASSTDASTILTLNTDLTESLSMDKGKAIILIGGYNAAYSARIGTHTGLVGALSVVSGSLAVDGLAIR
ncbi:MAG: right-handed parallel beta-helix repeat-containing protein [Desulfuromonadales bacterium]|nr:right-handed parallel beta-helix repeat-containing protein [Desulfuromonadales bacterium]